MNGEMHLPAEFDTKIVLYFIVILNGINQFYPGRRME